MITLSKKAKKSPAESVRTTNNNICTSRISVRDKLLVKEVQEMEANMPSTCKVKFEDPNTLYHFEVLVAPDEGFWAGGKFHFLIDIPEEYNMVPPQVKCVTRIWHPNIAEEGDICLSLLRQNSIDGLGWAPTRTLKDLIWGLNSLFTDLLNFDDPLNIEAAEHYQKDRDGFRTRVKEYISQFAKR